MEIKITAPVSSAGTEILTSEALDFVAFLAHRFDGRRRELLQRRQQRQTELDAGRARDLFGSEFHPAHRISHRLEREDGPSSVVDAGDLPVQREQRRA